MNQNDAFWQEMLRVSKELRTPGLSHYRCFTLRIGGKKRLIQCPSSMLKVLQVSALNEVLLAAAAHPSATAYMRGASILRNAHRHHRCKYMLKTDISNYFRSISSSCVRMALRACFADLDERKIEMLVEVVTLSDALPAGAPTSPHVSNLVMRDFDVSMTAKAGRLGVTYSRYADDITISGEDEEAVLAAGSTVSHLLRDLGLVENRSKTKLLRPCDRKIVTGLDVSGSRIRPTKRFRKKTAAMVRILEMRRKPGLIRRIEGRLGFWQSVCSTDTDLLRLRERWLTAAHQIKQEVSASGKSESLGIDYTALFG